VYYFISKYNFKNNQKLYSKTNLPEIAIFMGCNVPKGFVVAEVHESKDNGHKANLFCRSHRLLFIISLSKRT
jgi:hypothetical protein